MSAPLLAKQLASLEQQLCYAEILAGQLEHAISSKKSRGLASAADERQLAEVRKEQESIIQHRARVLSRFYQGEVRLT